MFIVPGVLGAVMQFVTTFLTLGTIVRERELGTFEQLVATPLRPVELMLGKLLPLVGLAYLNLTFILLVAWVWLGVTVKGSPVVLYNTHLRLFLLLPGAGYPHLHGVPHVPEAAQLAQLILLPSILLSGFLFPGESLRPQVLALLALGIVVFGAAIVRFQKKLD